MRTLAKITLVVMTISASLSFQSCKKDSPKITEEAPKESAHDGEHTFACPMHPEVTGKEGEDCPKCGMKLAHNDNAAAPSNVKMDFTTNPTTVNPNQSVTLSMTPKNKDNSSLQVPLDVEHTKKIHLIVVSEDLSWFDHIHPEYNADGSYSVTEKFPTAGKYTLFADYKPAKGNHTVDVLNVNVTGNVPKPKTYAADKLIGDGGDGFSVKLSPEGGKFLTNMPMHINGVMMQNGKEVNVNTLEDYLGAKAHMVVVSLADKNYLHVHPSVEGGKFDLHTTFDKPGIYRGWIQYQSNGKVHTSDFVFNVAEGKATDMKDMKHDGTHDMKNMK